MRLAVAVALDDFAAGHFGHFGDSILNFTLGDWGRAREAAPGTAAALEAFAERGWINALLTGNGPNRARYKVLAAGYSADTFDWEHSYFGHESPTRHHLTADAEAIKHVFAGFTELPAHT